MHSQVYDIWACQCCGSPQVTARVQMFCNIYQIYKLHREGIDLILTTWVGNSELEEIGFKFVALSEILIESLH